MAYELLKKRPFTSSDTFLDALDSVIEALSESEKVKLVLDNCAQIPKYTDRNPWRPPWPGRKTCWCQPSYPWVYKVRQGDNCEDCIFYLREQAEAGLHLLSAEEKSRLKSHNDKYRNKFGFTFIITARENKAAAILKGLDQRFLIQWQYRAIQIIWF